MCGTLMAVHTHAIQLLQHSVFTAYIALLISDNYRHHVGYVVICGKLTIRKRHLSENAL